MAALRSIGITPDALILRCDRDVPEALKDKIALMCDVDIDGVISTPDAPSIYDIPKVLHREELDAYVVRRLNLPFRDVDWTEWDDLLRRVHEPHETVRIALVGKYVELSDAYLSVIEALRAGGFKHHAKVEMRWVASDDCETASGAAAALGDVHGVLIPGGFGIRGIEGKIGAIRHARARGLPVLGLCLGLQCIVIEAARSVGLTEANSAEFDPATPDPVISTMADQEEIVAGEADLGGTMRLGAYPAVLEPDSIVAQAYGTTQVSERHRHRYEVNNAYRDKIAESGLRFSGTSPDGHLVEFVEYPPDIHPFVVGTQAHPELKSRPTRPHPLFVAFVGAAIDYKAGELLPVEIPEQHRPTAASIETASGGRYLSPRPVAEHVFETTSSETLVYRKDFRAAPRPGADAGRQRRHQGSRRALRRGRRCGDGRRRQHPDGLSVSPPVRSPAVGAAGRAARRRWRGGASHRGQGAERGGRPASRHLAGARRSRFHAGLQRRIGAGLSGHRVDARWAGPRRMTKKPT